MGVTAYGVTEILHVEQALIRDDFSGASMPRAVVTLPESCQDACLRRRRGCAHRQCAREESRFRTTEDARMKDLVDWLTRIGMQQYGPCFAAHRIDLAILPELGDADLEKIGVAALGDRRRILKAISALAAPGSSSGRMEAEASDHAPASERRQLTVMFCDLMGSTDLATRLDPEEWRRMLVTYHEAVAGAVGEYEGYVAQLLGDGALVYFGFPVAHEDDAIRSIRAALATVAAVHRIRGVPHQLRTRIGIATGLVVVDCIGAGTPASELSATGEAPNLAARLQASAPPDGVLISRQTRVLVGDAFQLEPMSPLELKGYPEPVPAWRVTGERQFESLFSAVRASPAAELIGRESELSLLVDRWRTACDGEGQVALLSGDAGIGKSRIAQALRDHVAGDSGRSILLQCSPYHVNSTLYPVVHALEIAADLPSSQSLDERRAALSRYLDECGAKLAGTTLDRLIDMLTPSASPRDASNTDAASINEATPEQRRKATLVALTEVFIAISTRTPLLLILEDAHWIDRTTEEWLSGMIARVDGRSLLLVITARPEYHATCVNRQHCTTLALSRLNHRHAQTLISRVAQSKALPDAVVREIVAKGDGVPLYIEEMTKAALALIDQGGPAADAGTALGRQIPSTLKDSLMARLDRLGLAKQVAQAAAVIGRDFDLRLLAETLTVTDAEAREALEKLLSAEIVFPRGSAGDTVYSFKHALLRDIAYESLVMRRRALLHGRIAQAIERLDPNLAADHPEIMALHHQEAGHLRDAIRYWEAAGDLAWWRCLGREAEMHYAKALGHLNGLPADLSRSEIELSLTLKRGEALATTDGYASAQTIRSYERARDLAQALNRTAELVQAWSNSAFALGRPHEVIEAMRNVHPEELASLEPHLRVTASLNLGVAHFLRGEMDEASRCLEEAMALDDVEQITHRHPVGGGDPAIVVRSYLARLRAMQGSLEQAERLGQQAMAIARERGHQPSVAWAMQTSIPFLILRGAFEEAAKEAARMLELSERLGFRTRIASGHVLLGRAMAGLGSTAMALAHFRAGWDIWSAAGGKFHLPEWGAHAADALVRAGWVDEARRFVADSCDIQDSTGQTYHEGELLRIAGRIHEADGDTGGAEHEYRRAGQIAEHMGLKLFSLRASRDLARLLLSQGRAGQALPGLAAAYAKFSEGHQFGDLREAKALLDAVETGT